MRTFYNTDQDSIMKNMLLPGGIKIRCKDGEIICDRLLFILWSKQWRDILDPHEEETVIIIPDLRTRVLNIFLKLLMTGRTSGLEIDFENFFDLAVDFLSDLQEVLQILNPQKSH